MKLENIQIGDRFVNTINNKTIVECVSTAPLLFQIILKGGAAAEYDVFSIIDWVDGYNAYLCSSGNLINLKYLPNQNGNYQITVSNNKVFRSYTAITRFCNWILKE